MRPGYRRATVLACSALVAGVIASPAYARHHHRHHTLHHHYHHRHHAKPVEASEPERVRPGPSDLYAFMRADYARKHAASRHLSRKQEARANSRRFHTARRHARGEALLAEAKASGGFFDDLVADARRYIGTNPTSRRTLWCGAFVDKILRDTGHKGGGNLALGYLHYGRRVSGPQVGSIAVMRRRGGGHVGVVAGVDSNGNPIIISGNHNHTTQAAVYPRRRIIAYVVPTN